MPFGTIIGSTLPRNSPLPLVLFITLLLGIGVTFAEPAIGALKAAGRNVSVEQAPYLFALLNEWSDVLVLAMGLGIGSAMNAVEGFGILCMASIGPIISVMVTGLWARYKAGLQTQAAVAKAAISADQEAQAVL